MRSSPSRKFILCTTGLGLIAVFILGFYVNTYNPSNYTGLPESWVSGSNITEAEKIENTKLQLMKVAEELCKMEQVMPNSLPKHIWFSDYKWRINKTNSQKHYFRDFGKIKFYSIFYVNVEYGDCWGTSLRLDGKRGFISSAGCNKVFEDYQKDKSDDLHVSYRPDFRIYSVEVDGTRKFVTLYFSKPILEDSISVDSISNGKYAINKFVASDLTVTNNDSDAIATISFAKPLTKDSKYILGITCAIRSTKGLLLPENVQIELEPDKYIEIK